MTLDGGCLNTCSRKWIQQKPVTDAPLESEKLRTFSTSRKLDSFKLWIVFVPRQCRHLAINNHQISSNVISDSLDTWLTCIPVPTTTRISAPAELWNLPISVHRRHPLQSIQLMNCANLLSFSNSENKSPSYQTDSSDKKDQTGYFCYNDKEQTLFFNYLQTLKVRLH